MGAESLKVLPKSEIDRCHQFMSALPQAVALDVIRLLLLTAIKLEGLLVPLLDFFFGKHQVALSQACKKLDGPGLCEHVLFKILFEVYLLVLGAGQLDRWVKSDHVADPYVRICEQTIEVADGVAEHLFCQRGKFALALQRGVIRSIHLLGAL